MSDRERIYAELAAPVGGIPDLSPLAPMEIKPNGAKQSRTGYRSDLVPAKAYLEVASVCAAGAEKYGPWNWVGLSIEDNLGHCLTHINAWLAGDRSDGHLGHAATRALFALEQELRGIKPDGITEYLGRPDPCA